MEVYNAVQNPPASYVTLVLHEELLLFVFVALPLLGVASSLYWLPANLIFALFSCQGQMMLFLCAHQQVLKAFSILFLWLLHHCENDRQLRPQHSEHKLDSVVLVFRTPGPYQRAEAFIWVLCCTTHTSF